MDEPVTLEPSSRESRTATFSIRVRLIGILASAAGRRELDITVDSPQTVSDLVSRLLETVGKRQFEEYLVDSGSRDPRPNVIILLNDQDCNISGGLGAIVPPDSTVTIIPVAHGG